MKSTPAQNAHTDLARSHSQSSAESPNRSRLGLYTGFKSSLLAVCIALACNGAVQNNLFDTRDIDTDGVDGWALSMDNDVFVPSSRDQDYTYGASITIAGDATRRYPVSLDTPLTWINQKIGPSGATVSPARHLVEFGVYGFTPEDITISEADTSDRPYAGIVYTSAIQELKTADPNVVWRTSLTLGVLGLDIVGDLQNDVHRAIGSDQAQGWAR